MRKIVAAILFIFIEFHSMAQGCSTCRAQIINSTKDDFTIGNGLNTGILFLMIVPYIILFFLFRKKLIIMFKALIAKKQ